MTFSLLSAFERLYPAEGRRKLLIQFKKRLPYCMRVSFFLILISLCSIQLISARDVRGQDINKVFISLELKNEPLVTALEKIQKLTPFTFAYNKREIKRVNNLNLAYNGRSVHTILEALLRNTTLQYEQVGNTIVISYRRDGRPDPDPASGGRLPSLLSSTAPDLEVKVRTITGTVTSENGTPIVGVSVTVRGSAGGTTTDGEGKFKLTIPDEGATLRFSSVGYETKTVSVGSQTTLNIQLKEVAAGLNDVVVIGYGTAKKSDLTGAVSSLKGDQLMDRPVPNVSQALEGKIPGVDVMINSSAPGQPAKVRVRGIGSINSSLDPLYVVDGVTGVDINTINPHEIASLEVLKDASSTAIYGARGANGVIMVTTKRGRKGDTRVTYDGNVNMATLNRHLKTLNAQQFVDVYNLSFANGTKFDNAGGVWTPPQPLNHASLPKLFDANDKPLYNTNWEKETYKTALSHDHFINIQGGSDKSVYSASLGYLNQDGLMINSWFKRYSAKLTLDNEVNSWLKFGGYINVIQSTQRMVSDGNGGLNVPRMVSEEVPIVPVKYPDGSWAGNNDIGGLEGGPNPVHISQSRYSLNNTLQALGDAYFTIHLTKELDLKSDFGYFVSGQKNNFYSAQDLPHLSQDQGGEAHINSYYNYFWQSENYLTWNKKINDHQKMTALLGASWQKYKQEWVDAESQNFIDDFFQYNVLDAGSVRSNTKSLSVPTWTMNSYYARVTYNIDDKYLFTATGRYDGSSRFGKNNQFAFFPSVGAAWRISEEDFMKHSDVISYMKIRGSYGLTGNSEIGFGLSQGQITPGVTVLNGANQSTLLPNYIGNKNLKWEKSLQGDVGLEFGLFRDRIQMNIDYYNRTTKDLLLQTPIPWSAGMQANNVYQNVGSVRNSGIEINLNTVNVKTADFKWSTNFIFAANRNKILNLNDGNADIFPGPNFLGQTNILRVGQSIGSFWGMTRLGTYSSDEGAEAALVGLKTGDRKYIYEKDGKTPHYSIIGHAYPKWTGTFNSTINYKDWDFSFDIRFVQGVNTAATFKHSSEDRQTIANSLATVLDAWTPEHQNTMISQVRNYKFAQDSHFDTWWVEDGSFIRGQNMTLGYTIPEATVRRMKLTKVRIAASVQNFFLHTKYTGYDPEVDTYNTTYGNNPAFSQNLDFFSYPRPMMWNLGLTVGF
jgi:TonB-linked SusC/RagA family outer membrane protein